MIHFCFCISGFSGTGKDEIAKQLVQKYNAIQTGLADPAKRHLHDIYNFTEIQLFGPSFHRNKGDLRYPKASFSKLTETEQRLAKRNTDPNYFLSPREALQKYCGLLNDLYLETWIRKGLSIHLELANSIIKITNDDFSIEKKYNRMRGVYEANSQLVSNSFVTCFSDFRHIHEINFIRAYYNGNFQLGQSNLTFMPVMIRIKRPSIPIPPYNHRSETEQATIPDSVFDFIINNDSDLNYLSQAVDQIVETVKSSSWSPKSDLI